MKKRIKIDSSILSLLIICTGTLFLFKDLYPKSNLTDNVFDFIGVIILLKGTLLRMIARGHKKKNSNKGGELVIDGPYLLTRNPMYLGSFLIGCGFILILWPWWSLPIFAWMFYTRFKHQIVTEEKFLTKHFGQAYEDYCRKVPRLFPSFTNMSRVQIKDVYNPREAFTTKEKNGIYSWFALAIFLEVCQEYIVFGTTNIERVLTIFLAATVVFVVVAGTLYYSQSVRS